MSAYTASCPHCHVLTNYGELITVNMSELRYNDSSCSPFPMNMVDCCNKETLIKELQQDRVNWAMVQDIARVIYISKVLSSGNKFMPVVLNEKNQVQDGAHRIWATKLLGKDTIEAVRKIDGYDVQFTVQKSKKGGQDESST
jgi:hypothetical protein